MELEQLNAVKGKYRDTFAVLTMQCGIERDVHLLQLEWAPRAHPLDDRAGVVAQMAAGLAIERYEGHPK